MGQLHSMPHLSTGSRLLGSTCKGSAALSVCNCAKEQRILEHRACHAVTNVSQSLRIQTVNQLATGCC